MLKKTTFLCRGLPANYDISGGVRQAIQTMDGRPMEHVFVTSADGDDWGCFGRGASALDDPNCRVVAEGHQDFHDRRIEAHESLDRRDPKAAQSKYFTLMKPALGNAFADMQMILGHEQYSKAIRVAPEDVVKFLMG